MFSVIRERMAAIFNEKLDFEVKINTFWFSERFYRNLLEVCCSNAIDSLDDTFSNRKISCLKL